MFNQRFLDRIPVDNLSTSAHGPQIVLGGTIHAVQYSIVIVGGPNNTPAQAVRRRGLRGHPITALGLLNSGIGASTRYYRKQAE